jgi:hypothetical protein
MNRDLKIVIRQALEGARTTGKVQLAWTEEAVHTLLEIRSHMLALLLFAALGPAYAAEPAILIAAGDIGYCDTPGAEQTARLLDEIPGTVIVPGDLAYGAKSGGLNGCYEPTWGRHKDRTWPAPGNHDYEPSYVGSYFAYWGERAGEPGKGYYSVEVGTWHVIALNSNIDAGTRSEQERWLREDLASTRARCILAFWHHPVFSSGHHGPDGRMLPLFEVLYEAGATLVIAGHDHNYERLARQDPRGKADSERGIRSFTVGTAGAKLRPLKHRMPNSEAWHSSSWGVLKLTLHPARYDWTFLSVDGVIVDSGSADCVERPLP